MYAKKEHDEINLLRMTANAIRLGYNYKDGKRISAKQVMMAGLERNFKHSTLGTLLDYYKRFRNELPDVYAKYNSYMYRQGYSASKYFYDNAKREVDGSMVIVTLDLPRNAKTINYNTLTIIVYYSGEKKDEIEATME